MAPQDLHRAVVRQLVGEGRLSLEDTVGQWLPGVVQMTATEPAPELGVRYRLGLGEVPSSCGGSYFGHPGELLGCRTWAGVTRDGTRTAVVYATSDGGRGTQQAMSTLVDRELCGTRS